MAAKILQNGDVYIDGQYYTGGADYAELFETFDGESIDAGYFVTFSDKSKIRKADSGDEYILGITSAIPGVLGNSGGLRWHHKYLTDEWGRVKYGEVNVVKEEYEDGKVVKKEYKEVQPILNPDYDNNTEYISRLQRKEWVSVGLLGQIRMRDNGKCEVNKYCTVGDGGIAIPAKEGYRIVERTGENQIVIVFSVFADYRYIGKFNDKLNEKQEQIDSLKKELDYIKQTFN